MTDQTQAPTTPTPAAGRITLEDVRGVVESIGQDTNAAKIRAVLGRGSFETIQKHLVTIRQEAEAASAPPAEPDSIPEMPANEMGAIWGLAFSAAQKHSFKRAEKLAQERDSSLSKLATLESDFQGLIVDLDEKQALILSLEKAENDLLANLIAIESNAAREKNELLEKMEADQAAHAAELAEARQELATAVADKKHAAELAESGRDLMRHELERLTDQVGELKAALYRRVDAPAVVTPSPAGE